MSGNEPNDRYARIKGLIGSGALPTKRANIIGVGRVGSWMAEALVRMGLATKSPGILRIFDPQTVEWANLTSTPYREAHARNHTPKVVGLEEVLRDNHSDVNVASSQTRVTVADAPKFARLARRTDLQVLSADDASAMFAIADACHDACPQVMVLVGPRADYAEIAFSVPGQTPRLTETLGRRRRDAIEGAQALGCDVTFITSFAAALCTRLCVGDGTGADLLGCYADAPLYVVGLRPGRFLFSNMPPGQRSIVLVAGPRASGPGSHP